MKPDDPIATAERVLADPAASDDAKTCARDLVKWERWARAMRDTGRRAAEARGE